MPRNLDTINQSVTRKISVVLHVYSSPVSIKN